MLWCGWPFFVRGYHSLRTRNLNMFTLIAVGTGAAFLYSVVATLMPGIFPPAMRDHHGLVPLYFEAAAVITALVLLGQVLELRARAQTSGAIRALLKLAPQDRAEGSIRTARPRRSRWKRSPSATSSASAPATTCRSTAWWSKGEARSTSRC